MQTKEEKVDAVTDFIFLGSRITVDRDCSHEVKRCLFLGRKSDKPRKRIKKQRHHFSNKGPSSESYGFSSSHVWMWESDHKEGWVLKSWYYWNVVLEKTLESPLDCKEIKPVNSKGNQPWIFTGRTDAEAEAEAPVLWPPDAKSRLTGKVPDAGKDEGRRRRGQQRMRWLDGITDSMGMNFSKLWEIVENRGAWRVHGVTQS